MKYYILSLLIVFVAQGVSVMNGEAFAQSGPNRVFVAQPLGTTEEQKRVITTKQVPMISSRDHVMAEVTRLGGKFEVDETKPGKPIIKIDLHSTAVTDSDLRFLENARNQLKELRYLDLRQTTITDVGVAKIRKLESLQTLNLFRTQLSDAGLAHVKNLKQLETLLMGGTRVTDAGLVHLKGLKELRKISLFQTQVTDAGVPRLVVLPKLEVLLIGGSKITDAGAKALQKALPRLSFAEMT